MHEIKLPIEVHLHAMVVRLLLQSIFRYFAAALVLVEDIVSQQQVSRERWWRDTESV
jgi:hypothetical protein